MLFLALNEIAILYFGVSSKVLNASFFNRYTVKVFLIISKKLNNGSSQQLALLQFQREVQCSYISTMQCKVIFSILLKGLKLSFAVFMSGSSVLLMETSYTKKEITASFCVKNSIFFEVELLLRYLITCSYNNSSIVKQEHNFRRKKLPHFSI